MKSGTEGVMDEWRQMQESIIELQNENAELRECIKKISKAITRECMNDCDLYEECKASGHGCLADKLAKSALKGGNHAND